MRSLVGLEVARQLLDSDDLPARLRGVERFASIATPESIDALVEKLEQGAAGVKDARVRLQAVRALASWASRDSVRQYLVREATEASSDPRLTGSQLGTVLRATAAMALAKSGEKKALAALGGAIVQLGSASDAAAKALVAYPPASLDSLLEGRKRLSPALAALVGELGDLRAIDRLRAMLEESDPTARAAAAKALAKLGDEAPMALAREWLTRAEARARRDGAEVLVTLGAAEAPQAITRLFAQESTRDDALRLALMAPSREVGDAVVAALASLSDEQKPLAIAALGRSGGDKALVELKAALAKPQLAIAAAFALAEQPGEAAKKALEAALASAKTHTDRRLFVRAAIVRALVLDEEIAGLSSAIDADVEAKDSAARAVAMFGQVALGRWSPSRALDRCGASCSADLIAAIARGALASDADDLMPFADRLSRAAIDPTKPPSLATTALGVGLLAKPDGGDVTTATLAAWAEAGGPLAPLAARALCSRDSDGIRPRIKRLLEGSDPVVRAHTALGLAHDPETSAVALLVSAYRFEEDASVRRAIVRALSVRSEVQRTATLKIARDLDPDDGVRSLARAALAGRAVDVSGPRKGLAAAGGVLWLTIASNDGKASPPSSLRAARLTRPDGLSVPVVADVDGALLIPAVPPGSSQLTLAPAGTVEGDAL